MKSISSGIRVLAVVTILLALGGFRVATLSQAQTAAPVASPAQYTICGNQPLCYEAADFGATITDFRTSTQGGYKVIDVVVRFQNKTNQPLILGYVAGSGTALDDRGNRYIVWGGNGFRGIGQVYGNSFDPKFNIRPGSFGDAQFELMWAPGQTVYGMTFELNLTVDEINVVEGNQHTLGGEFPLHYRGLANGVSAAAPGQASAFNSQGLPPCGPGATALGTANSAGGQVAAGANQAVSNAANALSSFGSLFGKNKTAAAAQNATAANTAVPSTASNAPCAPAGAATGGTAGTTSMSPVGAAGAQTAGGAYPGAAAPASAAKTALAPGAAAKSGATARPLTNAAATTVIRPVPNAAATTAARPVSNVAKPAPPATAVAKKPAVTTTPQKLVPANH